MGTVGGQTCASLGVPFEYNVCRLAAGSLAKLVNNLDHSSVRMAAGVMPIGRGWLQKAKPSQNRGRNLDGVFSVAHRVHIRTRARPILTRILPFTSAYADSFLFSLPNSQVEFTAVGGQRIWTVRLAPIHGHDSHRRKFRPCTPEGNILWRCFLRCALRASPQAATSAALARKRLCYLCSGT